MKTLVMLAVLVTWGCGGTVADSRPQDGPGEPSGGSEVKEPVAACKAWNEANPDIQVGTARSYRHVPYVDPYWHPIDGTTAPVEPTTGCVIVQTVTTGAWDLFCCP